MSLGFGGVLVAITVLCMQCAEAQRVHVVGDSIGWTIPQNGFAAYQTWASNNSFAVGDILLFNFATNAHDVLEVPKESFDSCSSANPKGSTITTGPANITLQTTGDHYYICTFGQHCQGGQKLAITVAATPGASPPSSTTPPPAITTPPATTSPTSPNNPANRTPPPASSPPNMNDGSPTPNFSAAGVSASLFLVLVSIIMSVFF